MASGDGTVDGATAIDNYDFLKVVNSNFADLVGHYIGLWDSYHLVFAMIASNIVAWGGLAWVGVLMLKSPVDKLRTASGGLLMVGLASAFLSVGSFSIPGAYNDVKLANGSGWSIKIIGNLYALFKSGLDSLKQDDAFQLAFENAYHITDEETLKRFVDSPMADLYKDYINKCQPAFEAVAGQNAAARKAGRFVGFYGSGGIGQAEVEWKSSKGMFDRLTADKPEYQDSLVQSSIWHDGGGAVEEGIREGIRLLQAIPVDQNPFDGKTIPPNGYKLPTKAYWENELFRTGVEGAQYEDAREYQGGHYLNSAYADAAGAPDTAGAQNIYPKNCYDLYRLVDAGQRNWQDAVKDNVNIGQANALGRDGRDAGTLLYRQIENQLRNEQALNGTTLQTLAGYGGNYLFDYGGGPRLGAMTMDTAMTTFQDIGKEFKEWMLKYKIPAMINGCAMLAAILVVMFPLICIMSVFMSPKIMISFVKLMVFAFLVPFTNDACLSMASTLLAVNGELLEGYNAGNFTRNNTLLISAGSAQYIIFIAITAIEIIFAKMLIWDDVKGMGNFNPGGAATGMAATGAAVVGSLVKFGGMIFSGGGSAVASSAASGAKASLGGAVSKMRELGIMRAGNNTAGPRYSGSRSAQSGNSANPRTSQGLNVGVAPTHRHTPPTPPTPPIPTPTLNPPKKP